MFRAPLLSTTKGLSRVCPHPPTETCSSLYGHLPPKEENEAKLRKTSCGLLTNHIDVSPKPVQRVENLETSWRLGLAVTGVSFPVAANPMTKDNISAATVFRAMPQFFAFGFIVAIPCMEKSQCLDLLGCDPGLTASKASAQWSQTS